MLLTKVKHHLAHNERFAKLNHALILIKESTPVQWLLIREERIAAGFYYLWLTGCVYWVYQFIVVEAQPHPGWLYVIEDTSDALMVLFFGSFSLLYVVGIALFVCKFIYNLFTDGMESLFPRQWHSAARSVSYILILGFSFLYIPNIKVVGLTAFQQVSRLVQTSEQHEEIVEKHFHHIKELFDNTAKPAD